MKRVALLAIVILASNLVMAAELRCRWNHFGDEGFKASAGAGKFQQAKCIGPNKQAYKATIAGLGAHFLAPLMGNVTIKCTTDRVLGDFYGVDFDVAGGLGTELGLFGNKHGVCGVGAWQSGLGIGLTGALLRIEKLELK